MPLTTHLEQLVSLLPPQRISYFNAFLRLLFKDFFFLSTNWISITSCKCICQLRPCAAQKHLHFHMGIINLDLCSIMCFACIGRKFPEWHKFHCAVSGGRRTDSWNQSDVHDGLCVAVPGMLTYWIIKMWASWDKIACSRRFLKSTGAINNQKLWCWGTVFSRLLMIDKSYLSKGFHQNGQDKVSLIKWTYQKISDGEQLLHSWVKVCHARLGTWKDTACYKWFIWELHLCKMWPWCPFCLHD